MTAIIWDQVGERTFQTGVDRGVLFLKNGQGVPWNGLTSVDDDSTFQVASAYLDGVKYLQAVAPSDYSGTLKAFTYPEELDELTGLLTVTDGLRYHDQPPKSFNLCYRTLIGNDTEGLDYKYKIHFLYNLFAVPASNSYETLSDGTPKPIEFSWALSGTPPRYPNFRPTVHLSIDSEETPDDLMKLIENIIYGTAYSNPSLPSLQDLLVLFGFRGMLVIIDHLDGTWSAVDESETYISMLDDTTFQIVGANVTMLDYFTYTISDTNNPHVDPETDEPDEPPTPTTTSLFNEWILGTSGLYRYWRMNSLSPFADESGNYSVLNFTGTADVDPVSGLLPYDDDLASNWISGTPYSAAQGDLGDLTNQWSFGCLFKTTTNNRIIIKIDDWTLQLTDATAGEAVVMFRPGPSGTANIRSTSYVDDGEMHFVVVTSNGSGLALYLDGVFHESMAWTTPLPSSEIIIGRGNSSFVGVLDEIFVFNCPLNSSEQLDGYNAIFIPR